MKKILNKTVGIILAIVILSAATVGAVDIKTYSENLSVYYNNVDVYAQSANKPIIINDRTMVQIKPIFEMMGFTAKYNDADKKVTFTKGTAEYAFISEDVNIYSGSDAVKTLDVPAMIYNNTFYVPLRGFCDVFDINIDWEATARKVSLSSEGIANNNEENSNQEYSKFMGKWYGYGTDGEDAMFETDLTAIDENSFLFKEKGYGINHAKSTDEFKMTMINDSIAESEIFTNGKELKSKLVIKFGTFADGSIGFYDYFVNAETNEICSESSLHIREPKLKYKNYDWYTFEYEQNENIENTTLQLSPGAPSQYGCDYHISEEVAIALIKQKYGVSVSFDSAANTSYIFTGEGRAFRVERYYETDNIDEVVIDELNGYLQNK